MGRIALAGAVVGGLVSSCFWVAYAFFGYTFDTAVLIFWPSSFALGGLPDNSGVAVSAAFWVASGLANAALYALLAVCIGMVYRIFNKRVSGHA